MNRPDKIKCVSGDCEEMIYYPFWKRHGGYCTKHPEKYPKITRENGSGDKPHAKTTYYKRNINGLSPQSQSWLDDLNKEALDRQGLNNNEN